MTLEFFEKELRSRGRNIERPRNLTDQEVKDAIELLDRSLGMQLMADVMWLLAWKLALAQNAVKMLLDAKIDDKPPPADLFKELGELCRPQK